MPINGVSRIIKILRTKLQEERLYLSTNLITLKSIHTALGLRESLYVFLTTPVSVATKKCN